MPEPIELLASAARIRVQDKRHSALWHFIRANWRRVRQWHEREGMTFRAMAELLADHPDFAPDGRHAAPTERSVRVAYRSVEGFLGDRAEVPALRKARVGTPGSPTGESDPQGRSGDRGGRLPTETVPAGGRPALDHKPSPPDDPDEPRTTFKTARLRGGKPSAEAE